MFWLVLIIIFFLISEGFFSGSEIAVVSANRATLQANAGKGSQQAKLMLYLLEKPELLIGTTLIGTNLSLVCLNFAANELFSRVVSKDLSWAAVAFTIPMALFVGEILPKAYFRRYADVISYKVIKSLKFFSTAFFPIVILLRAASGLIRNLATSSPTTRAPYITREEFRMLLESHSFAPVDGLIIRMLGNLSAYMEKTVGDIVIPMVNVVHCKPKDSYIKIADIFERSNLSRLPVYDHQKDEITGIINDLQLLEPKNRTRAAAAIAEKTICIPENLALSRTLILMRKEYREMAAVIDEYGGTVGIVTLKDIIAEITGKLADRYETDRQGYIHSVLKNVFIADASFRLDELENKTGVHLEEFPFDTISGLLNYILGRIPQKDDTCKYGKLVFKVLRARPQKAEMVRITVKER